MESKRNYHLRGTVFRYHRGVSDTGHTKTESTLTSPKYIPVTQINKVNIKPIILLCPAFIICPFPVTIFYYNAL